MRRGISAIIATILLIIMTVGIAALMYTWMSGMLGQLTTQATQQVVQQTALDFKLSPLAVDRNTKTFTVAITNTGTATIETAKVGKYAYVTVYSKLTPGTPTDTYQCTIDDFTLSPGQVTQQTVTCNNLPSIDLTKEYYVLKIIIGQVSREVTFS